MEVGAIPLLVLCVQEPELSLRRIAASALSDVAKHSPEVSLDPYKQRKKINKQTACSIRC